MMVQAVINAAKIVGVSSNLLLAMCFQESSLQNKFRPKDGNSASYGICQMKLKTARTIDPEIKPADLMDPNTNALLAAYYLKYQLKRYKWKTWCAVEAYNKGHAQACLESKHARRVRKHLQERPWLVH